MSAEPRHAPRLGRALLLLAALAPSLAAQELPPRRDLEALRAYIKAGWTTLSRSAADLATAAPDPKLRLPPGTPWPVYVPAAEDRARIDAELRASLSPAQLATLELRPLPPAPWAIVDHGLLYLPRPYVVPGGRFNEMYGWDSYFIQVGLLRDGEIRLAQDLVENFVYQIRNYGTLLNANRTYYLTRSQPPFLTRMLLGVYERTQDREWLRGAWPAVEAYYRFWSAEPHLVPELGLARYFDLGNGPAPEVLSDERDAQGRTHYDRVREFYRTQAATGYEVSLYYDSRAGRLTDLFYKGDRSMRESGFDPSTRFGAFNVDVIHYAPVCLNVLLYRMEEDAAEIRRTLEDREGARVWEERAQARRRRIDSYLWDAEAGLYFDYSFRDGERRRYPFLTTFYPLWAGIASRKQAEQVVGNLPLFEAPGGLRTSTEVTGSQWDAPFGWAPLHLIAVQGLRRYGYHRDADRVARKFVALVAKEWKEHGTILEKYDVERRESDVSAGIRYGYSSNEVGFGWTNAAVLELLAGLEEPRR